jgi:hypothetical protein
MTGGLAMIDEGGSVRVAVHLDLSDLRRDSWQVSIADLTPRTVT